MEFEKEELNEILNVFQQESNEIIASMDDKLLLFEKNKDNKDLSIQLFRDAHSLKGSARMLGFENIQNIAHKIEDVINLVKEEKLKMNSEIADAISECLAIILISINKTVESKKEYTDPQTKEKLDNLLLVTEENLKIQQAELAEKTQYSPEEQDFIFNFNIIEDIIIDILSIITTARKDNNYENIVNIENHINDFLNLIQDINFEFIKKIKIILENIKKSLDNFKNTKNQSLEFLEINSLVNSLIEEIVAYTNKKCIKRKNYYEIVNEITEKKDENNLDNAQFKLDNQIISLIQELPLVDINSDTHNKIMSDIDNLISSISEETSKEILKTVKEILTIYKTKEINIPSIILNSLKNFIENVNSKDDSLLKKTLNELKLIKPMVEFEQKDKLVSKSPHKDNEIIQADILNSITNAETKTLKVDSIKLDNLVNQIGELIVSKIKTNEQLMLAKHINNNLMEWQKNFNKMNYYIKYFDKKYLSNSTLQNFNANSKIVAYNKQLLNLSEQHSEKILSLIKEMNTLFKHIQENETKLNTTTTEIEAMVKNMRILPLSTIFKLFPRMVHNIARDKNKKIDLIINGSEITADKTIVEELKIPIMHIIRNSIDHGIEEAETRLELGKNAIGKIEIDAYYKDSMIVVDIKDDGKGLDIEKIKNKALEKNILTQEEIDSISNEELTNLIFYPGFSTEDFVTELSGRGLGLDIVNNKINQLQGRIDVFSQYNQGTLVRITLPSVVATKKTFIIEEQNQLYAIETLAIKTILRINSDEIFEKDDNNYFIYNNTPIPVYALSQILNLKTTDENDKYTLAIIEMDNANFGLAINKLICDQDIVPKQLSAPLYKVKHISGITTLANGETCLLLNMGDIISTITSKKSRTKFITKNLITATKDNYKFKILIVDDSHTTRILQKNILSNYGYNVTSIAEPSQALQKIKEMQYDLIVTDIKMPNMNGFELIKEIRGIPEYGNTPIIVVSSEKSEKYKKELSQVNIVRYIQKNVFKQNELIETIEKTLKV